MALSAQQLQQIFAGGMTPSTPNMNSIYGGVLPSMGGGNPALNAINASAPSSSTGPASWMAYEGGVPVGASMGAAMPPMPRPRPGSAPTSIDMAAINGQPQGTPAVNSVTGQMQPNGGPNGGLLSLLFGGSKNGLPGLAGLLGGPQQGGLLQMLFGGNRSGAAVPASAYPTSPAVTTVGRALGTNGYIYGLGSNGKYSQQGKGAAFAGLTPAQQYAALTGGPGTVSATERWHGGGSSNPQSGGPAVGGSYGGMT